MEKYVLFYKFYLNFCLFIEETLIVSNPVFQN